MAKCLLICNSDGALYKFRYPIIKALIEQGHEVHSISTASSPEGSFIGDLKRMGVVTHTADFSGRSIGVLSIINLFMFILKKILEVKPDIIHCFTHKANVVGGLASMLSTNKNRLYLSVTGMGLLYSYDKVSYRFGRLLVNWIYRILGRRSNNIFFQNHDDANYFLSKGLLKSDKVLVTNGSGFDPSMIPTHEVKPISKAEFLKRHGFLGHELLVLYPSRALFEKGINEYIEAIERINLVRDDFVFLHIGSPSLDEASGMTKTKISNTKLRNAIFFEHKPNIFQYFQLSDVVVLPSYREGTPRAIIEALYYDKYIVTTDAPGCNETVVNRWNGDLIKPKSSISLASAIINIDSALIDRNKGRSKLIFERKYHSKHIVKQTLGCYFDCE
ncbi:glycosyltransferase family 4 protein [Vibrio cyclitrophicus]|uniref:glycosyltransferase family 4 protein n=1 Tax=Vibrio cyclitrophicus TaxID=47951 RepID=UPI0003195AD4|nr:glycosyltransferase family 4 protein [Vibrio cyclitrophicus]